MVFTVSSVHTFIFSNSFGTGVRESGYGRGRLVEACMVRNLDG